MRVRVTVRGKVQGVYFRASMKEQADRVGVLGWVRNNTTDGTVEALLSGSADAVGSLLDWAQRGPEGSRVDSVEWKVAGGDEDGAGEAMLEDFRIVQNR